MGRTDVRAGRHGGDIRRDRDQKAGRRRALPRRPDPHGHRRLRVDDGGIDVACRIDEPAWRPKGDDDDGGVFPIGPFDCLLGVFDRDGMDDPVDFGDDDARCALPCTAGGREREERQAEQERRASDAHD